MLLEELTQSVDALVEESLPEKSDDPRDYNMDRRVGRTVWVADDFIAVPIQDWSTWLYYGGFEYVDPQYIVHIGSYILISREAGERVDRFYI